jgi:hypothetical protein
MAGEPGPSRGSQLLEEWRGGATQAKAAELLKLDPASYNRFENGKRRPSAHVGFDIERYTEGAVPAKSWYEPPFKTPKADEAKAS